MGLYDRVAGSTQWSTGPSITEQGAASTEPKSFKPIELEEVLEGLTGPIGLMEDPR